MPHHLTPAKIGLLVLIDIYANGGVPRDATLPVLHFLASHVVDSVVPQDSPDPTDHWQKPIDKVTLVGSISEFEKVLSPHGAVVALPGQRLWEVFLKKLWRIDSLDSMYRFFMEGLPRLLVMTKEERRLAMQQGGEDDLPDVDEVRLSRGSPLGGFVRQATVEFARLSVPTASELWSSFVKYRMPTFTSWSRRNSGVSPLSFDSVLLSGQHEWAAGVDGLVGAMYGDLRNEGQNSPPTASLEDLESLFEFQVTHLQRYGTRTPIEVRNRLQSFIKSSVLIPSAKHYIDFLEAWRSGDYSNAFDGLHRYFDYAMQNRDRIFYQYALLNLAVLQGDFGCHKDAVETMLEAVQTARENRDKVCLNYALNWVFHFGRAHPHLVRDLESSSILGGSEEMLSFMRVRARESGTGALWSTVLLSEARETLCSGESVASAAESLVRCQRVLVLHNMRTAMGAQFVLAGTLWDRLGQADLSRTTCEVFLRCYARQSMVEDELKVTCRMAGLLSAQGRYDEALERLEALDADHLRAWKVGQYWDRLRALVKLRRELHRGETRASDHLLSQLLQTRADDVDPDLRFIFNSLHVEALMRKGELGAATAKVNALIAQHRDGGKDVGMRVRLLIAKAQLHEAAGRPRKGLTLVVRAASAAWRARLLPVLWMTLGLLSNILNSLGEFDESVRLLTQVVPRALECGSYYITGLLYFYLADAYMGLAGGLADEAEPAMRAMQREKQRERGMKGGGAREDAGGQQKRNKKNGAAGVEWKPWGRRTGKEADASSRILPPHLHLEGRDATVGTQTDNANTGGRLSLIGVPSSEDDLSEDEEKDDRDSPGLTAAIDPADILPNDVEPSYSSWPWPEDAPSPRAAARQMMELMAMAGEALESAYGHFAAVEDVRKQCEVRAKQAAIMRAVGEIELAEDYAAQYLVLKKGGGAGVPVDAGADAGAATAGVSLTKG